MHVLNQVASCVRGLLIANVHRITLIWAATQVVNELRLECAGKDATGRARTPTAVAWSLQRYLIFAILCCIPGKPLPILPDMACHKKKAMLPHVAVYIPCCVPGKMSLPTLSMSWKYDHCLSAR